MSQTTEAVTRSVLVPLAPDEAFALFTDRVADWWPDASHHILDADAVEVVMEVREGGRWYERAADGRECDWGYVREVDRPGRILLAWHLDPRWEFDPDPAKATDVEVSFTAEGDGTRVTLEHRGFEVHGGAGAPMRESVASDGGWSHLLAQYRGAA